VDTHFTDVRLFSIVAKACRSGAWAQPAKGLGRNSGLGAGSRRGRVCVRGLDGCFVEHTRVATPGVAFELAAAKELADRDPLYRPSGASGGQEH